MINDNNIGKYIKDKLEDYQQKPSPEVWNQLEKRIAGSSSGSGFNPNWWYAAGLVVVAAVAYVVVTINSIDDPSVPKNEKQELLVEQQQDKMPAPPDAKADGEIQESQPQAQPEKHKEQSHNLQIDVPPENDQSIRELEPNEPEALTPDPLYSSDKYVPEKMQIDNDTAEWRPANNEEIADTPEKSIVFSENQKVCTGEEVVLWASGGETYQWSNGSRDSAITLNPEQSSWYTVRVWNQKGEVLQHEFNVEVKECGMLYVPNAFTPNADGYNDIFKAYGTAIEDFRMQIMNKNGLMVFKSENLNQGWDGTYDNQPAPAGVYLYRIVYTGIEGETKTKTGTITLIR
ncbi:MAG: gliding motility-associated C-terminal domain-containing protein [Bacteroidales bacterium]